MSETRSTPRANRRTDTAAAPIAEPTDPPRPLTAPSAAPVRRVPRTRLVPAFPTGPFRLRPTPDSSPASMRTGTPGSSARTDGCASTSALRAAATGATRSAVCG